MSLIVAHETNAECQEAAQGHLQDAFEEERWMAVVFVVRDDKIFVAETSCNFPHDAHEGCLKELKKLLQDKRAKDITEDLRPLPFAKHLRKTEEKVNVNPYSDLPQDIDRQDLENS